MQWTLFTRDEVSGRRNLNGGASFHPKSRRIPDLVLIETSGDAPHGDEADWVFEILFGCDPTSSAVPFYMDTYETLAMIMRETDRTLLSSTYGVVDEITLLMKVMEIGLIVPMARDEEEP